MSLRARLSGIERKLAPRDFLTIFVSGGSADYIGTDPFNESDLDSRPRPSESIEAFVDRVRGDAIRAGKSQIAIFGSPRKDTLFGRPKPASIR